jgi:hypothetical protein
VENSATTCGQRFRGEIRMSNPSVNLSGPRIKCSKRPQSTIQVQRDSCAFNDEYISLLTRGPGGLNAVPVTPDNFIRAESDRYFGKIAKNGGFGRFTHNRELIS